MRRVAFTAGVLLLVGCGDASGIASDHWGGVGTGNDNGTSGTQPTPSGDSGSSGGGTDAGTIAEGGSQTQSFQVMTDKTSYSVELRATTTVQVTIAPQGFTGTIDLAVSGLPTDASGAFVPASVNVSGTTGATSTLTLTTLSTVVPGTAPFTITATAGTESVTSAPMLEVMSQITISIPVNVASLEGTSGTPSTNAFGTYPIVMNAPSGFGTAQPITVRFLNLDSAPHCIHASNATQGFPHDSVTNGVCNTPMAKGTYDQTNHPVNTKGSYAFYLHDQGDLTDGMIKIQ
jgi:hypothetical protein